MNFLFLGIFFLDFSEVISIFNNKNELKNSKKQVNSARVPRGWDVALRATWQRHAGHAAPTWLLRIFIIYLHSTYNGYATFRISEGFSNSLFIGYYKPDDRLYFFSCGTNPHSLF